MNRFHFAAITISVIIALSSSPAKAQWLPIGNPPDDSLSPAITCIYVTNCELFTGTTRGLFISTDGCKTWKTADAIGPKLLVTAIVRNASTFYAGTNTGSIFRTDDNGVSWSRTGTFDSTYCMAVNDRFIFAGTSRGIRRCAVDDTMWVPAEGVISGRGISSFAMQDSTVLAGGADSGMFRSVDYGESWNAIEDGVVTASPVMALVYHGNTVFASLSIGGVYRSPDNGATWSRCPGLPSGTYGQLAMLDSTITVFVNDLVYCSVDYGETWQQVNDGLETAKGNCFFTAGSELYVGTAGDGIWHRSLQDLYVPVVKMPGCTPVSDQQLFISGKTLFLQSATILQTDRIALYDTRGRCRGSWDVEGERNMRFSLDGIGPGRYVIRMERAAVIQPVLLVDR
jgi:photosystem II stability/assembly factor-like uncharacterized protein